MNISKAFNIEILNCSDKNYRWFGVKITRETVLNLLNIIDENSIWNFRYIFGLVSHQFSFNQGINNDYLNKIKSTFLNDSSLKWLYILANDDNGLILEYHKEIITINEEPKTKIRLRKLHNPTFEEVDIDEFFKDVQLIVYHSGLFEVRKNSQRKGRIIYNYSGYEDFNRTFNKLGEDIINIEFYKNYKKQHWVNEKDWKIIKEYIKNNEIENCMEYEL